MVKCDSQFNTRLFQIIEPSFLHFLFVHCLHVIPITFVFIMILLKLLL